MKRKFLIKSKGKNSLTSLSFILSLFLLIVLTISFASAYARTNIAYTSTYISGTQGTGTYLYDRSMCGAGQDFILQISPTGCIPSVVRSDLLEDQNVPVFCPITATQLNPLIDVEVIKTIDFSFSGSKPLEIQGSPIYVPARAALGVYGAELDNAILDNIGYAVIVLKKQKNESAMADSVSGNLTARIRYDIQNAFGVGEASFYLPELSENEWGENLVKYSFWDGRGYLRAEAIDENSASISIYSDRETHGFGSTGEKRKISVSTLNVGEKSAEIPMPGFNYCLGTMTVKLDRVENPDTRVRLNINGDVNEFKEGEKFLDNNCQIKDIEKFGLIEKVTIKCDEDEGADKFDLIISPKVNLSIEGHFPKVYSIGQWLYEKNDKKSVYLAYVGTKGNSGKEEDLFIVTATIPGNNERLTDDELDSVSSFVERMNSLGKIDSLPLLLIDTLKLYGFAGESIVRKIVEGQGFSKSLYFGETKNIAGKQIKLNGFGEAHDTELSEESEEYYEKAMEDYDDILESFSVDKYPEYDERTLGEKALSKKIELAESANQKKTVAELCEEFKEKYSGFVAPLTCSETLKLSSSESAIRDVEIDRRIKRISFEGVEEPDFNDYGIELLVESSQEKPTLYQLRKNDIIYLNEEKTEFVQLVDLDKDSAKLKVDLEKASTWGELEEAVAKVSDVKTKTLKSGSPENFGSNYLFTLQEIHLKKLAKVSVIPNVKYSETKANFSFQIGIEKRGIQLSPEKITEKI